MDEVCSINSDSMSPALRRESIWENVATVCKYAIAVLLILAGMEKLRQPYEFLSAVYGYGILSPRMGLLFAASIPWVEMICGAFILGNVLQKGVWLTLTGAFGVFFAAQTYGYLQGTGIRCGCFNPLSTDDAGLISLYSISFALILCAGSAWLFLGEIRIRRPGPEQV